MAQEKFWPGEENYHQKFLVPSMTQRRISKELLIYAYKTNGVKLLKNKKLYLVGLFLAVQWEPVGIFQVSVL